MFILFFSAYIFAIYLVIQGIKVWDSITFNKNYFNKEYNRFVR